MPRSHFIASETHPYHVTARCNNQEFFPIALKEVWEIMLHQLKRLHDEDHLAIHAFVLMGNHFHLLCHTPKANLNLIMQKFMRRTSFAILRRAQSQNHLWGGRYKWSIIDSQTHYFHVYRYIYQNPVRAQIVSKVEYYPYSSLKPVTFPLHTSVPMSFGGEEGELIWLNEFFNNDEIELIQSGLRKYQFDINPRRLKSSNKLSDD